MKYAKNKASDLQGKCSLDLGTAARVVVPLSRDSGRGKRPPSGPLSSRTRERLGRCLLQSSKPRIFYQRVAEVVGLLIIIYSPKW